MDSPEFPTGDGRAAGRRELNLQGPRPTPLMVRKDSHKIKKPPIHPVRPQQQHQHQLQQQQQLGGHHHAASASQQLQQRAPVIIYTVSPKVIHTKVDDFMTLVQQLTGSTSSASSNSSLATTTSGYYYDSNSTSYGGGGDGGAISPAARFASIEKANSIQQGEHRYSSPSSKTRNEGDLENCGAAERITSSFPGILSPLPSSLPPISPNFFSPMTTDLNINNNNHQINSFGFLQDLISPGNPFLSPSSNFFFNSSLSITPIPSPTPPFDIFNHFV